jgi:hypothetical protein
MLQWLKLAWCFRAFEVIGPRIYAILYTLRDSALIAFLTLVGFITAGFVHAFYVLGTSSGPAPVYAAFLEVFRLIYMGDFDLDELSGGAEVFVDTMAFYVHLWFFGAAVWVRVTDESPAGGPRERLRALRRELPGILHPRPRAPSPQLGRWAASAGLPAQV